MNYWWANQNQTFKVEVGGGFLWSPKTRADGTRNQFYENMTEVEPGDVIFSFCDTRIKAVGIALQRAVSAEKPSFGLFTGSNWQDEGWLVSAEFYVFAQPKRPKDHIELLRPHLPVKYSPLQATGDGLQSVYLASVPFSMAEVLIQVIGPEYPSALDLLRHRIDPDVEAPATVLERELIERTDIGPTQKQQLINARRGQGLFRANVRLHEKSCRLTQISDPEHLRASHIKPWKDSSDSEKIDGSNGLFLAPHIDHLFDRGFIAFADSGHLLISPALTSTIANSWGVVNGRDIGSFTEKQKNYLGYHRKNVFKAAKND